MDRQSYRKVKIIDSLKRQRQNLFEKDGIWRDSVVSMHFAGTVASIYPASLGTFRYAMLLNASLNDLSLVGEMATVVNYREKESEE